MKTENQKVNHTVRKMACKYRAAPALRTPHFPTPNCSAPTLLPAPLLQFQAYMLSQSPAEPVSSEPRRHR